MMNIQFYIHKLAWISFILIILIGAFNYVLGNEEMKDQNIKYAQIEDKIIYFGHQSIGGEILDGVKKLKDPRVRILDIDEYAGNIDSPAIYHSLIGANRKPETKIAHFKKIIDNRFNGNVDIAFMKLCFIDFNDETDIDKLFNQYKNTIDFLQKKYPNIQIVHITVPLTVLQEGPKAWLKKILGKPVGGFTGNIKRNQFNDKIRNYFSNHYVFELDVMESTFPDGTASTFIDEENGRVYRSMVPEYTYDGAHINEKFRLNVAESFLKFLSSVDIKDRYEY